MAEQGISRPLGDKRSYFILRRLHSLFGIIPVGVFLCFHLTINSTILGDDGRSFDFAVSQIHTLARMGLLVPVEVAFIFAPMFFHAFLGVVILLNGSMNVTAHPYGGNVRYFLQRATGIIAFAFILVHLWQMHWLGKPFDGAHFDAHRAAASAAEAMQTSGVWAAVYFVGVAASVYHLANGLWTALITWGITVGPRSQRGSGLACAALAVLLGAVGLGALYGFTTFDHQKYAAQEAAQTADAAGGPRSH